MRELSTTADVIDALGGNIAVAELTECTDSKSPSNWRSWEAFPPKTYVVMQRALAERGCTAPPSLWKMVGLTDDITGALQPEAVR